ncbi:MAG: hypothetical protein WAW88_12105 [Nocardioides sp.]
MTLGNKRITEHDFTRKVPADVTGARMKENFVPHIRTSDHSQPRRWSRWCSSHLFSDALSNGNVAPRGNRDFANGAFTRDGHPLTASGGGDLDGDLITETRPLSLKRVGVQELPS